MEGNCESCFYGWKQPMMESYKCTDISNKNYLKSFNKNERMDCCKEVGKGYFPERSM